MSDDNDNLFELILGGGGQDSGLVEGAAAMYALYETFVEAGFSESQAFELVKSMLVQSLK